jgi:sulfur carrier protein ThiS
LPSAGAGVAQGVATGGEGASPTGGLAPQAKGFSRTMPMVLIPPPYRGPTRGKAEVETSGANVIDCLRQVERHSPGFLSLVLDDGGRIHRYVKLFVNEQPVDSASLDAPVSSDDRIQVLAAIAGG